MYLVLFDVDGTLVDSQHMIVAAMAEAFAAIGRPAPERETVLGIVGLSLPEAMRRLVPEADETVVGRMTAAYKTAFQAARAGPDHQEPLFPGARAVLDRLAARDDVLLGVATGKSRRGVAAMVALHGLEGRFVTVQTADDHPSKPHPSMVTTALAETGVAPDRAVVIGDSSYDMQMARAAGIAAFGVSWGYQDPETLRRSGAHIVLDAYDEVVPALARRFGWQ